VTNTSQQHTPGQPPSVHQELPSAELPRPRPFNQVLKIIEEAPTSWNYRSEGEPLLKLELTPAERSSALETLKDSVDRASVPVPEREALSPSLPAPVYDAFKAYISANDISWCPQLARIVQGIEEGFLTAREIAVVRKVINQDTWAASIEIDISPEDPSVVTAEDIEQMLFSHFRTIYRANRVSERVFQGYGAELPLWKELKELAPAAKDDYEQRAALLERIIRDTARSLNSPDRMVETLAGLASNSRTLSLLIGLPTEPCEKATILLKERELASSPLSRILQRLEEDVGLFSSKHGQPETFAIGAPLVVREDGVRRMLSPSIPVEGEILRNMLVVYIEELIHAQQDLKAALLFQRAENKGDICDTEHTRDALLCDLAVEYVVTEEKLKGRTRDSNLSNLAGECDVALRMLEIFTAEAVPLHHLNPVLFESHQEVRREFLAWLAEKGVALPPRPQ
jgi:hypothetical protein